MLIVVHHRDVTFFFQTTLDLETFRSLYVLQIDASKCRSKGFYNLNKLVGIILGHFKVEAIQSGKNLKQKCLALHHGFTGQRANVAKAEDCRSVRDNGDEIAFVGVFIDILRIFFYLLTGIGHTRRIGQSKVVLSCIRFCRDYFNFARLTLTVVFQSCFFGYG